MTERWITCPACKRTTEPPDPEDDGWTDGECLQAICDHCGAPIAVHVSVEVRLVPHIPFYSEMERAEQADEWQETSRFGYEAARSALDKGYAKLAVHHQRRSALDAKTARWFLGACE